MFLTAALSGLVLPIVITYINAQSAAHQKSDDEERAEREKRRDEERVRHDDIVQAQARLLREFTEAAITYVTLVLDISWFGSDYLHSPQLQARQSNDTVLVLSIFGPHCESTSVKLISLESVRKHF